MGLVWEFSVRMAHFQEHLLLLRCSLLNPPAVAVVEEEFGEVWAELRDAPPADGEHSLVIPVILSVDLRTFHHRLRAVFGPCPASLHSWTLFSGPRLERISADHHHHH